MQWATWHRVVEGSVEQFVTLHVKPHKQTPSRVFSSQEASRSTLRGGCCSMLRERCTVSTIDSSSLQSSKLSLVAPWRGNFHWERLKPGQAHGVSAETPSGRLATVSANNTAWDSYSITKNMNEFASRSASLMCPLETDILSWYRVDTYQHFGETWQLSWRWTQQVSPKHWYTFQNPVILTCSAITPLQLVRNSVLMPSTTLAKPQR